MTSESMNNALVEQNPSSSSLEPEARAIVLLLAYGEASLRAHAYDSGFVDVIQQCSSRIRKRFGLADCDPAKNTETESHVANLGGLLRLLAYVRLEIRDKLEDARSTAELGACIDRLSGSLHRIQ